MAFHFVGLSGPPRSGSTLLCQMLNAHPEIHCEGHSSPVCNAVLKTRHLISDDSFFLAQLDAHFDTAYANLRGALQGFVRGWYAQRGDTQVVVDKNRAWLKAFDVLLQLEPDARLIVTIRELGQVYGSMEAQHERTVLIDFADHLADLDRFGRADYLFAHDKTIGAELLAINAVQDLPQAMRERILFVRFEELVRTPREKMATIFNWLGVAPYAIDPGQLTVRAHESDSHYRHKFTHRQQGQVSVPDEHQIPPRIQANIERAWASYYLQFYPWVGSDD
jgi:sulfotransferase